MSTPLLLSGEKESYASLEEDSIKDSRTNFLELPVKNGQTISQRSSNGIINGERSSADEYLSDFANLGLGQSWNDPSTTIALEFCKKYILYSYNILLIMIGWRRLRSQYDYLPWYKKLYNAIYPVFIFLMLLLATVCQTVTCFSRGRSMGPRPVGNYTVLDCADHFLSYNLLTSLIVLVAFPVGVYIFRWAEPENISSLAETVFLSYNRTSLQKSRKRPVYVLLCFFGLGLIWLFSSAGINILRFYTLGFADSNTVIYWFIKNGSNYEADEIINTNNLKFSRHNYQIIRYTLSISALLGFTFYDLLYIAIVLNYCFQCQLLSFYIRNIVDKVHSKAYNTLSEACKDIYRVYEFLKILNGLLSLVTTLAVFIFIMAIIVSYKNLNRTNGDLVQNVTLGFLNLFQWITAAAFPIILAVHFTRAGKRLMRLGLAIAQRPYNYSTVPEIELQFFLNYVNSTNYSARLMFIPMYPSVVGGATFTIVLLLSVGLFIPHLNSIKWF